MIIREYKDSNKESVIHFLENQLDELNVCDPFDRKRKEGYGEHSLTNLLEQNKEKGKIFIAKVDGKTVGYISGWVKLIKKFEYQTGGPTVNGMFDNIYVLPEYRNQGIAKALINKLEKYFKENNCELIWLNVFSKNEKAVKMYYDLGYTPSSTTFIKRLK